MDAGIIEARRALSKRPCTRKFDLVLEKGRKMDAGASKFAFDEARC